MTFNEYREAVTDHVELTWERANGKPLDNLEAAAVVALNLTIVRQGWTEVCPVSDIGNAVAAAAALRRRTEVGIVEDSGVEGGGA